MGPILSHVSIILGLPLAFALGLMRGAKSQWEWQSALALTVVITAWAVVIGRWDMAGYPLRVALPIGVAAAVFWNMRNRKTRTEKLPRGRVLNFSVILNLVLTVAFAVQAVIGMAGLFTAQEGIQLAFPLQEGAYYVAQGGSTVFVNYHADYTPQAYALDITRLNSFGYRAGGVYPKDLGKYTIFGDRVYSPCTGKIAEARDGLPDHEPPRRDEQRPEGNFVVILCEDSYVFLAHLQQYSVLVEVGEEVTVGQPLGRIGNSGNTTEPHLHIHAERDLDIEGEIHRIGVPIRFNGRFLSRNHVVRSRVTPSFL